MISGCGERNAHAAPRKGYPLKDAHLRFRSWLEAVADCIGPFGYLVVPDFPIRQAAYEWGCAELRSGRWRPGSVTQSRGTKIPSGRKISEEFEVFKSQLGTICTDRGLEPDKLTFGDFTELVAA